MPASTKAVMQTTENIISKELKKQIGQILEVARQDFNRLEENKKERLLRLAREIEETGYPKDMICEEICKNIAGKGVSDRYIRMILPKEYKKKKPETNVIVDHGSASVVADKNKIEDDSIPNKSENVPIPEVVDQETNPTIDTDLKIPSNDSIQEAQLEQIDQEKEELKTEVEDLKKHVLQLKHELSVLKDLPEVGLRQQKVKIPANELTKVLINRAMKMGEEYLELPVENGMAKLPKTKV
jgi:hypothetical protein